MTLAKRIIARLDIKGKNLIKGIRFEGLRVIGDALEIAEKYYLSGIDEILYIDAVASLYGRNSLSEILSETSKKVFVPITAGGGIKNVNDAKSLICNGADKVAINTGLVDDIELANKLVKVFGSQCIVASIQAKRNDQLGWEVMKESGRERTGNSVYDWIEILQQKGVGEILLTSVDKDGLCKGSENELIEKCAEICKVPLIVGGGFAKKQEIEKTLKDPRISAVSVGAAFHKNIIKVDDLKIKIKNNNQNLIRSLDSNKDINIKKVNFRSNRLRRKKIIILDYGLGNHVSLLNALSKLNFDAEISSIKKDIRNSDLVFLPGVGSFAQGIKNLKEKELFQLLIEIVKKGKPLIGICLGMQMMLEKGYEDSINNGLGLIKGEVKFMGDICNCKHMVIPHVGWNFIKSCDTDSSMRFDKPLMQYFVHSFNSISVPKDQQLYTFNYFEKEWIASVIKENIIGFQFHPERSGEDGLWLLNNSINFLLDK